MSIWKRFWDDELGAVVSAELVTVGTLGVIGATVGLNAAGDAVNEELKEYAYAIRSLDQSYSVEGHATCRAHTAGSCYVQPPVEDSLADLCGFEEQQQDARPTPRPDRRPRLRPGTRRRPESWPDGRRRPNHSPRATAVPEAEEQI